MDKFNGLMASLGLSSSQDKKKPKTINNLRNISVFTHQHGKPESVMDFRSNIPIAKRMMTGFQLHFYLMSYFFPFSDCSLLYLEPHTREWIKVPADETNLIKIIKRGDTNPIFKLNELSAQKAIDKMDAKHRDVILAVLKLSFRDRLELFVKRFVNENYRKKYGVVMGGGILTLLNAIDQGIIAKPAEPICNAQGFVIV